MAAYNLKPVKSPRFSGRTLDLFSRLLRFPVIGTLIQELLKRQNGVREMVRFATSPHPRFEGGAEGEPQPLLPLYYPIHDMTSEEEVMHRKMVEEAPLDLQKLLAMGNNQKPGRGEFRHWTIADYTTRYMEEAITPSQVVERIISAVETMNAQSNNLSVVSQMDVAELRSQAAESTKRYRDGNAMGVLDGVPFLVKDEIPTVGFPVTKGTSFLAEPVEKDPLPIAKLRQQGALLVGKANQHELGMGTTGYNRLHGTPKNPYGKDGIHYYTGGSSSGSAAAVSMGLVPLAIGGDGGGSIRIPSSLCGCVGLKPTFKRIAVDSSAGYSIIHFGPLASSVHDAALAYAVMAGAAEDDHRHQSQKQPPVHLHDYVTNDERSGSSSLEGIRIGIFEDHIEDADANVVAATRRAIEHYRSLGADIVSVSFSHLHEIHLAHSVTITTEVASAMKSHSSDFNKLSPETRISLIIGECWSGTEFLAAQKIRSYAMQQIEDLFRNTVDVILSPATPCCAPLFEKSAKPRGESNLAQTTALMKYVIHGNLTGVPAIVFPIAYDEETSLPISLQIQAAHWREDLLFCVASASQGILEDGVAKPELFVDILGERPPL